MLKTLSLINPISFFKGAIYSLLFISLFYYPLLYLLKQWQKDDFTYGFLIPLIVIYLIWEKKEVLAKSSSLSSWIGLIPFLFGLILFWLGELGGEYTLLYLSIWFLISGLFWIHLGWEKLKEIPFAIFFILTMFPLPSFLYTKISVQLKLISSQIGVTMMQTFGMSAFREGNIIDLGFTQLQVVDACSGLRYLIPLIILGILLAYFFKASWWKKGVLVVSTIPISVVVNSVRIASVGILYQFWGPVVAEGFFHDFSGWFIFLAALGILLLEMLVLKNIKRRPEAIGDGLREDKKELIAGKPNVEELNSLTPQQLNSFSTNKTSFRSFFSPPQFVVAVILLSATLALSHGVEFRERVPISRPFDEFPLQLGEWSGVRQSMEQRFIDTLDLSDYVIVDYQDEQGRNVNFYVAYYESQRKGESIHTPATCLPGSGWLFKETGGVAVPLKDHNPVSMTVNRALMQKEDYKQLSYYWFPARGRILTNAYQLKLYTFWDALTQQRTDGALVRVITPVYEEEGAEDADERLQEFVSEIVPVLSEYLPD